MKPRSVAKLTILLAALALLYDHRATLFGSLPDLLPPVLTTPQLGTVVIIEQAEDRPPFLGQLIRSSFTDQLRSSGITIGILDADSEEARSKYQSVLQGETLPLVLVFSDSDRYLGAFPLPGSLPDFRTSLSGLATYADSSE